MNIDQYKALIESETGRLEVLNQINRQIVAAYSNAVNNWIHNSYNWKEFIRYCNTPCISYKVK